jgi:hypothetical protein
MHIRTSIDDEEYTWDEIYTLSGSSLSPWSLIRQATERRGSAVEGVSVLRAWIDECLTSHPDCMIQTKPLPTRVLDVSNDKICLFISCGQESPYAALSHCWGKIPIIQATTSALQVNLDGISWDNLSQTFKDAVTTTRMLGLQYLWIDSPCII